MVDKIIVQFIFFQNKHFFYDAGQFVWKQLHEAITFGRAQDNDIKTDFPWVSRYHGRIFLEQGFFTEHLDYEDYSSAGSLVIHIDGYSSKSEYVHKKKVKIKPNSWILIQEGGQNGVILIPTIG